MLLRTMVLQKNKYIIFSFKLKYLEEQGNDLNPNNHLDNLLPVIFSFAELLTRK